MTAQPHDEPDRGSRPSDEDFAAARETLGRLSDPPAAGTDEYETMFKKLAGFRASIGADRFDLRFGRRSPRNGIERLEIQANREGWSEERFDSEGRAHISRPIDEEMLSAFCDAIMERVDRYALALSRIIKAATDQRDQDRGFREQGEIEAEIASACSGLPLYVQEITTVLDFFRKLRAVKGEPVRCRVWTAESAHSLVLQVLEYASNAWSAMSKTSEQSRCDSAYTRASSAAELFYGAVIEPDRTPTPRDLIALISLERTSAEHALAEEQPAGTTTEPTPVALREVDPSVLELFDTHLHTGDLPPDGKSKYQPSGWFPKELRPRIWAAARRDPGAMHVQSIKDGNGVKFYCVDDVRRYWPQDLPADYRP